MGQPIPVPYRELGKDNGLISGCDDRGPWERKPYLINWGDRYTFRNFMRGTTSLTGGTSTGLWIRSKIPYQHPEDPTMYARGVQIEPYGAMLVTNSPTITYDHAVATVSFAVPDNQWEPLPATQYPTLATNDTEAKYLLWATQEFDFDSNMTFSKGGSLKWLSDGKLLENGKADLTFVANITITYHRFPLIPLEFITKYVNNVNSVPLFGMGIGTLLFCGAKTVTEMDSDGNNTRKVTQLYKWRDIDWNKELRPDNYTWDYIVGRGGSSTYIHPYSDLSLSLLGSYPYG